MTKFQDMVVWGVIAISLITIVTVPILLIIRINQGKFDCIPYRNDAQQYNQYAN